MIQKQRSDTSDVFDRRLDSDGPQKCNPESITGTYAICPGESKIPFAYQTFLPEDVRTTTTNMLAAHKLGRGHLESDSPSVDASDNDVVEALLYTKGGRLVIVNDNYSVLNPMWLLAYLKNIRHVLERGCYHGMHATSQLVPELATIFEVVIRHRWHML
jgi:hypothetical protein